MFTLSRLFSLIIPLNGLYILVNSICIPLFILSIVSTMPTLRFHILRYSLIPLTVPRSLCSPSLRSMCAIHTTLWKTYGIFTFLYYIHL